MGGVTCATRRLLSAFCALHSCMDLTHNNVSTDAILPRSFGPSQTVHSH